MSPVVAKEAHTDGTRVVQCQSDDQNFMKTTIMQMPMDYLEIPRRLGTLMLKLNNAVIQMKFKHKRSG